MKSTTLILKSDLDELVKLENFLENISANYSNFEDLFPDMMLSVTEAVSNAIIHGNEFDPEKEVTIDCIQDNNKLEVQVSDQGNGFNPNSIPNPVENENLLKSGGRGVYLMKHYTKSISYNDKGNKVILIFNIE